MTDSYVERILINKFLELASSNLVAKCKQFYEDNKIAFEDPDKEALVPQFFKDNFRPEYEAGDTTEDKLRKDSIKLYYGTEDFASLIDWKKLYAEYFEDTESEYNTPEEDELFKAIDEVSLNLTTDKELRKNMTIIDNEGNKITVPLYSVVFENTTTERSEVSEDFTVGWYEVYFTPTAPNQIELGTKGRNRWTGFLQINICVPTNWGTSELLYRYDEIAELFRQGMVIDGVRIHRVYRGPNLTESDFTWCPVTVEWKADLVR